MSPVSRLMRGFLSPIDGFQLIVSSRKNITYAIIPFIIGIIFLVIGYYSANSYLRPMVDTWAEGLQFLNDWPIIGAITNGLIFIFSWVIISLLNFLAAYICIIIFAGPFYALMVENIFRETLSHHSSRGTLRLALTMFGVALVKVVLFTLVGILCFFLAFIPGLNLITGFILVLLVAIDCADYAFETDFLSLSQRIQFAGSHLIEFTGLALAILCTGFLPGSFFLLLPAFICGATKMYIQSSNNSV